jgi:hypothetical protein
MISLSTPTKFGDIFYVPEVCDFTVDDLVYCDASPYSQLLVPSDICGPMTTCSSGGGKYFLNFLDAIFTNISIGSVPLFFIDDSMNDTCYHARCMLSKANLNPQICELRLVA